jgi:RNA polymerase sigma-70 factor, ECF subfamily
MRATDLLPAIALPEESARAVESTLLQRLRRGDPAVIGVLYDQHHAAVRAFARRLIGEDAAAEDLVHEVFVSLPKAARRFQGDASLRTFLIGIAVNHARHHLRAAARRRAAMERLAEASPAPIAMDPEDHAVQASLARALVRALDALPLDQRVAFVLCEVDEHTSREAAEITGAPEATIRTRVFHARQKLRAALEEQGFR